MGTKKSGNGADPAVEVLLRIEARLTAVETTTERGFGRIRDELNKGLDKVNERLDKVIENTGGHYRNLEARVQRLEQDVRDIKAH